MQKRTHSKTYPIPQRRKQKIYFPVDVRSEFVESTTGGDPETHYSFIKTELLDNGQDITDATWINEKAKELKLDCLAELRWEKETAGITVNGSEIKTDDISQGKINAAYSAVSIDPTMLIDWKGVNGWIQMNATQITAIASAVSQYIQACFTHEKTLQTLIDTDVNTDITTGWPTQEITL